MSWHLFYVQLYASVYLTGLLWMVQFAHYPLLAEVGREQFVRYETLNQTRTGWAVGLPILIEAATAVAMWWSPPPGVPRWAAWLGLALLAIVNGSTFAYFVPVHNRLAQGYDAALIAQLVRWNWVRTIAWTARGLLLMWLLVTTHTPPNGQ